MSSAARHARSRSPIDSARAVLSSPPAQHAPRSATVPPNQISARHEPHRVGVPETRQQQAQHDGDDQRPARGAAGAGACSRAHRLPRPGPGRPGRRTRARAAASAASRSRPGRAVGQQQAPHPRPRGDAPGLASAGEMRHALGHRGPGPERRLAHQHVAARRQLGQLRARGRSRRRSTSGAPPRSRRTAFVGGRCGTSRWRSTRPPPRSTSPAPGANVLEREGVVPAAPSPRRRPAARAGRAGRSRAARRPAPGPQTM